MSKLIPNISAQDVKGLKEFELKVEKVLLNFRLYAKPAREMIKIKNNKIQK